MLGSAVSAARQATVLCAPRFCRRVLNALLSFYVDKHVKEEGLGRRVGRAVTATIFTPDQTAHAEILMIVFVKL